MSLIIEVACNLKTIQIQHLPPVFDNCLLSWIICFWCVCTDRSSGAVSLSLSLWAADKQEGGADLTGVAKTDSTLWARLEQRSGVWLITAVIQTHKTHISSQVAAFQPCIQPLCDEKLFVMIMNEPSHAILPFCVWVGDKWFTFQVLLQLLFAQT